MASAPETSLWSRWRVVGAGLMLRSMLALRAVDPGFDADGVVAVRLTVPSGEFPDARRTEEFHRQLVDGVTALAGVEAAGLASGVAPTDPITYGVVTAALVGVAWLACWAPAARAARIQPSRALEAE